MNFIDSLRPLYFASLSKAVKKKVTHQAEKWASLIAYSWLIIVLHSKRQLVASLDENWIVNPSVKNLPFIAAQLNAGLKC